MANTKLKNSKSFLQNKLDIEDIDLEFEYDDTCVRPPITHEDESEHIFSDIDEKSLNLFDDKSEEDEEEEDHTAAHTRADEKQPIGGSDEQILKDMRKTVFSVPLLHQEDVDKLFGQIDNCLFPIVHSILNTSLSSFEEIILVLSKVAAGNTYGKNIYEKTQEYFEEEESNASRGTYREHELKFIKKSYDIFRLFAIQSTDDVYLKTKVNIQDAMAKCDFIRGVYEDILINFVKKTEDYCSYHWKALQAKVDDDYDGYHKLIDKITDFDSSLKLNKFAFFVARDVKSIHKKYMDLRSQIIQPYLRSVYSVAKGTAKNSHQLLDNFQNGSIGLMRAVSCYSSKRKSCFASVAKCWIAQSMLLSIKEDANFVKLPVSTWQAYTQLEKAKVKLGVSSDENISLIAKTAKMSLKKAKSVYTTVKISQVYSLNRTYDQDEKLTLEDIMTDENKLCGEIDPFTILIREYCEIADLTDLEICVLAVRYGMFDLIRSKEVDLSECLKETLIQNLARLGYNYKIV